MSWLLVAAWLLPLILAALGHRERFWWTPAVAALPALAASLSLPTGVQLEIPWLLLGSRLGLDETGRLFLLFTSVLWLAAGAYAAQSLRRQPHAGRFRVYFLLAMGGNLWLILAQDLVSFYAGFALMGLASYGLVIHHGDREALRAGRVYLSMTLVGELALFCALVLIAVQTGTLAPTPEQLTDLRGLTIALLLFGLAIKAGLVPLHVWLPLAHPAAPVPASAVLSGAMIKVALLGWLRFLPVGQVALPDWGLLLVFAGLITLFFAIPIGLVQSDPKVILAYSSVSKMGFLSLILGLILLEPTLAPGGVLALVLYAAHHALAKGGLFLGVGLRHHAALQPLVLVGLVLLALSLAGTPASGGAVAKYGLKPVLQGPDWAWLGAVVTLGAVGTTFLMARLLWVLWRTDPRPSPGYLWGGAAWVLLIGLVLLYPLVLGSPAAWFSGTTPIGIGLAIAGLMALVAWRKPRVLGPLVNLVRPGDLLALVRPVLAVLALLGHGLWRGWVGILKGVQTHLEALLVPLGRVARDPERRLRDWPTAGGLWLGVVSLLLAVLLVGRPQGPLVDSRPERMAKTTTIEQTPGSEDIASDRAITEDVEAPARGAVVAPSPTMTTPGGHPPEIAKDAEAPSAAEPAAAPTASVHAESPGPATEITEAPERGPRAEDEVAGQSAAGPREAEAAASARSQDAQSPLTATESPAECDPAEVFVLRHPAVSPPLELATCVLHGGRPKRVSAPPLSNRLVKLVQHYLDDLGYAPGPLDGLIGPRTLEAVRRFQRHEGLAATGVLSFELLERLQNAHAKGGRP